MHVRVRAGGVLAVRGSAAPGDMAASGGAVAAVDLVRRIAAVRPSRSVGALPLRAEVLQGGRQEAGGDPAVVVLQPATLPAKSLQVPQVPRHQILLRPGIYRSTYTPQ